MPNAARWLGVREGEGTRVALVAALFASIEAARGVGEVGADTLVVSRFGAAVLPVLYVALGLVSLAAALVFGAALGRLRRGPLLIGFLATAAAIMVALGVAARMMDLTVVPVLWLAVLATGGIATTIAWSVAGSVFDARQAKRLFPVCTAAAIAGGFAGTLGAGPLARLAGTEALVIAEAALLGVGAIVIGRILVPSGSAAVPGRPSSSGAPRPAASIARELRAGFDEVVASPLLRLVAAAYVVFSVLQFSVTFPFFQAMDRAFPQEADLATAIGLLSAAVTAGSFVVSLLIAPRLYRRFGVATAALALPLVYIAGFTLWLAQFSVTTAATVRVAQQVTQRGVSNAAWSAFYNVVPGARRAQVLAFMDGVPGQIGITLSGLLLLLASAAQAGPPVFLIGLAAAIVCAGLVIGIRRRYAASLLRTLRSGMGERLIEGGPGLDALAGGEVAGALVAALEAPEPSVRRMAAQLLARVAGSHAATALSERAADPDPSVRIAVLDALRAVGDTSPDARAAIDRLDDHDPAVRAAAVRAMEVLDPPALLAASDALLGDPSPGVRAAVAVALVRADEEDRPHAALAALLAADDPAERIAGLEAVGMLGGHDPSERIPDFLDDPDPGVRAAAVRALAAIDGSESISEPFLAALDDDARQVRDAAAGVLRARPIPPDGIVEVLVEGSERAQDAALSALDGHGPVVRAPLLDWASTQVSRAVRLGAQRSVLIGSGAGSGTTADIPVPAGSDATAAGFLGYLLATREQAIILRLLRALAVLGAPEAAGLIRRCLRSNDPETRAQAIEALDSIGDGGLRRGIVGLLDDRATNAAGDPNLVLQDLGADPDPWIRALALRARAEQVMATWSTLSEQGRADPSPIVRAALRSLAGPRATGDQRLADGVASAESGGGAVPETIHALDDIDRMLFLRRVPLFRELEPEDLQRIATSATEAHYGPEEPLVREGELGNEMVIIVEGTVRVLRQDPDGSQRHLRDYGPGDHIGELALLRERPRAATVVADAPGVRGLRIHGDGLMAILRERPEAAMAMLATLAERMGTQG
jgi:HEAT repeat protein